MRGYEHARGSLDVATHLKRESVFYEDVVPLASLLGGPADDLEAFVQAQLGPLLGDPMAEDLVKSLQTFYSSGQSVAAAARELFVHRRTLEYRLQRIEALLGRDLKGPRRSLATRTGSGYPPEWCEKGRAHLGPSFHGDRPCFLQLPSRFSTITLKKAKIN